jgi:3-oxoacyl-[acyl-carrier protein] reductase
MPPARNLHDSVALVTGGGGGIGSAICRVLAGAGARVVITHRGNAARATAVAAALPGGPHHVAQASVTDSSALRALAGDIRQRYGRLDVLVNNAGITRPVPHADLDALDDALIDSIFQTNWRGAFAAVRAMRALLQEGDGGVVVNISSIAGMTGIGSNVAYCASKAALNAMTISLGRALAPKVRVVAVSPGWVDGDYARQADPAYLREQIARTPLGRLASADDVAATVLAVITLMPFTTGCVIPVDGGRPFV